MATHAHAPVHTILVLDLDGTLRGPGEIIGSGVANFLREQVRRGVGIVPCSGKSADVLDELFRRLEVSIIAIGAENGGHLVYDPRGSAREEVCLTDELTLWAVKEHLEVCPECSRGVVAVEPKRSILTRRFGNHERAARTAPVWRDHVSRFLRQPVEVFTYTCDDAVDLVLHPDRIRKWEVIRFLRARHPVTRIIVAGDGLNDLSMMDRPDVMPVCPANAVPEVIEIVRRHRGIIAQAPYGAGTMEALRMAMRMGRQIDLFDSAGGPA